MKDVNIHPSPRNVIINLGLASVDNDIPGGDIFDFHSLGNVISIIYRAQGFSYFSVVRSRGLLNLGKYHLSHQI